MLPLVGSRTARILTSCLHKTFRELPVTAGMLGIGQPQQVDPFPTQTLQRELVSLLPTYIVRVVLIYMFMTVT
jgi:hypothetical protein